MCFYCRYVGLLRFEVRVRPIKGYYMDCTIYIVPLGPISVIGGNLRCLRFSSDVFDSLHALDCSCMSPHMHEAGVSKACTGGVDRVCQWLLNL